MEAFSLLFTCWFFFVCFPPLLLVQPWQHMGNKNDFCETSLWGKTLFCQKTTRCYSSEEAKLLPLFFFLFSFLFAFYGALLHLCLGCLIKCSFLLIVECVPAFCRSVPRCLLQSAHMVCLSVYDFSYTGVVRFLNHLSTRGPSSPTFKQ